MKEMSQGERDLLATLMEVNQLAMKARVAYQPSHEQNEEWVLPPLEKIESIILDVFERYGV